MGFLRQFLWVPFVLGTLLGGLTFADIYARWTETGWAGVPADIIAAYDALRDYFTTLIVIDWLDLPTPPPWAVDFVVLSLVGWTTLIRATVRFRGSEEQRNTVFDFITIAIERAPRKISYHLPLHLVFYAFYIINVIIMIMQPLYLVILSAVFTVFGLLPIVLFAPRQAQPLLAGWRSELLFTGAAILNAAIAFGLLYWNSIAISRVVS